jgi:DNA invertase Pin-like site-specific DNA recombinase
MTQSGWGEKMKVGYVKVSTGLQNLDLQEYSFKTNGCKKIFVDKLSGVKKKREGLEAVLEFVRSGDTLVVWRLDRLGRNKQDLIRIVNDLNERGRMVK